MFLILYLKTLPQYCSGKHYKNYTIKGNFWILPLNIHDKISTQILSKEVRFTTIMILW